MIESEVDYNKAQNTILTSVILIIGVSGAKIYRRGRIERDGAGDHLGIGLSLIFKLISLLRRKKWYWRQMMRSPRISNRLPGSDARFLSHRSMW
ncbi:hypothetical protein KCP74_12735 [Salmonella enterica subsp. enterica]|nr:hypothetical protein KCP74_12735 [Salmonella enterica subsp. enterica]